MIFYRWEVYISFFFYPTKTNFDLIFLNDLLPTNTRTLHSGITVVFKLPKLSFYFVLETWKTFAPLLLIKLNIIFRFPLFLIPLFGSSCFCVFLHTVLTFLVKLDSAQTFVVNSRLLFFYSFSNSFIQLI